MAAWGLGFRVPYRTLTAEKLGASLRVASRDATAGRGEHDDATEQWGRGVAAEAGG